MLTRKYPECLVEYRPIIINGYVIGIECINGGKVDKLLGHIEKRVDIERARRAGCKTPEQICGYFNGVKR